MTDLLPLHNINTLQIFLQLVGWSKQAGTNSFVTANIQDVHSPPSWHNLTWKVFSRAQLCPLVTTN